MASSTFTVINNQILSHNGGNGTFDLFVGNQITNPNNMPSARLVVNYSNIQPVSDGSVALQFGLSVVLEGLAANGTWFPCAYQFESFKDSANGNTRVIVLQPDISDFNTGIDDIMYVADATVARISRQQGKMPGAFRARVVLRENGWTAGVRGPGAFQQVNVTITGELYDGL